MTVVNLYSVRDTDLDQGYPDMNFGSDYMGSVGLFAGRILRALYGFDFSSIPSADSISSAILYIYYYWGASSTANFTVSRCTSTFEEYVATWNNQPAITTTNQVVISVGTPGWYSWNITNLVKDAKNISNNCDIRLHADTTPYYKSWETKESSNVPYIVVTYTGYDNRYVNTSTGNDANAGDSCVAGHPVLTFKKAYDFLNPNGTIHVCNSGADFSGETVTLNKSFSMDLNGASGYWYMPQVS